MFSYLGLHLYVVVLEFSVMCFEGSNTCLLPRNQYIKVNNCQVIVKYASLCLTYDGNQITGVRMHGILAFSRVIMSITKPLSSLRQFVLSLSKDILWFDPSTRKTKAKTLWTGLFKSLLSLFLSYTFTTSFLCWSWLEHSSMRPQETFKCLIPNRKQFNAASRNMHVCACFQPRFTVTKIKNNCKFKFSNTIITAGRKPPAIPSLSFWRLRFSYVKINVDLFAILITAVA